MRIVQLSSKSVCFFLSVDILTFSQNGEEIFTPCYPAFIPLSNCYCLYLKLMFILLSQSNPVTINFVEVTAKMGTSFFNSHLVYLNREGKKVKKSEEPRVCW